MPKLSYLCSPKNSKNNNKAKPSKSCYSLLATKYCPPVLGGRTDERSKSKGCLRTMPCKEEVAKGNRSVGGYLSLLTTKYCPPVLGGRAKRRGLSLTIHYSLLKVINKATTESCYSLLATKYLKYERKSKMPYHRLRPCWLHCRNLRFTR